MIRGDVHTFNASSTFRCSDARVPLSLERTQFRNLALRDAPAAAAPNRYVEITPPYYFPRNDNWSETSSAATSQHLPLWPG